MNDYQEIEDMIKVDRMLTLNYKKMGISDDEFVILLILLI